MGGKTSSIGVHALAAACLKRTGRLVRKHGPRLAGTPPCTETAEDIARQARMFADSVRMEPFRVHPGSFYSYMKILPISYLVGMAALFAVGTIGPVAAGAAGALAVAGLASGISLMIFQFSLYRHVGDALFAPRTAANVEAVVEPVGRAKRELILSGHHDSAPVARIFSGPFSRLYPVAILAPYLFFVGELALLVAFLAGSAAPSRGWALPFLLAGLPFVVGYFLLVALRRGTPGAGDNLVSSMMAVGLGKEIAARKASLLASTRIRIVSFDAEEAGLRGASAYFKAHAAELSRLPCVHLNFDSLYRLRDLQVLTSDINGTVGLSPSLAELLVACARECGFAMRTFGMIFGAGGTDAAESARRGIPSTSIIALPTDIFRDRLVYHTMRDTVEQIEPAAVEACLRITLRLLSKLEAGEIIDGSRPGSRTGHRAPRAARRRS
jgi:aminopeptidase YwaD